MISQEEALPPLRLLMDLIITHLVLLQHALVLLVLNHQTSFTLVLTQSGNSQLLLQQRNLLLVLHTHTHTVSSSRTEPAEPVGGASYFLDEGVVMAIVLRVAVGGGGVHVEQPGSSTVQRTGGGGLHTHIGGVTIATCRAVFMLLHIMKTSVMSL